MFRPVLKAAIVAVPLMAAAAQAQDADTVVATVDGQDITLGQMIVMRQSVQDPAMAGMPAEALWDTLLDQLVRQAAVAHAAEDTPMLRAQQELQARNTAATAFVGQMAEAEPSDEELQAAYDKLFADAEAVQEYNAAHILVETEEEAKDLKAQLDDGADFGDLAEQHSTGPSGPNRGDLGWFAADQMVAPFAEAVAAMEPGAISDPVQTDFGWHVIKLNETRMQEAPSLDEVRAELAQMVRREKVETEIERIAGEAEVTRTEDLDPALLQDDSLLESE
ncbi:peptidylprolyl isomerase [Paracoccus sp. 1_MG-2023]|uniref:peptidylprolyl isomerase n=1 Tax=unclassified Paracoccus (in: a-proteobacteria) TaxID=2688777 RepID=UPI001C0897F0|nr:MULTISPECIES: peptidylprolyl isomerase [unclassified Paracoccus (in: a-proteobacteria)]MBU2957022.1 peptidylprolyl isomerase [Paracoccus sp. C2R09]MDO6668219.1 peptidylprolyl isomerase [Paracoccus sp. 1_MG-2023]